MDPPVLVTRALEDAERLVAALCAQGRPAIVAPCLHYESALLPSTALDRWRGLRIDIVVTSPRAVPFLSTVPIDGRWRIVALAGGTASALDDAGVRVDTRVVGGAAEAGAATREGAVVCIGSDLAGEQLLAVRPDATVLIAYHTRCPDRLPVDAIAATAGTFSVFAASPSALHNFESLAPGALTRAHAVWCHGRTTLAEAERLGVSRCFLRNEQEFLDATPPPPPPL